MSTGRTYNQYPMSFGDFTSFRVEAQNLASGDFFYVQLNYTGAPPFSALYCMSCVSCVVCGVWCVVCGVWCVVCGVWCVVCGVWCVVCGGVVDFLYVVEERNHFEVTPIGFAAEVPEDKFGIPQPNARSGTHFHDVSNRIVHILFNSIGNAHGFQVNPQPPPHPPCPHTLLVPTPSLSPHPPCPHTLLVPSLSPPTRKPHPLATQVRANICPREEDGGCPLPLPEFAQQENFFRYWSDEAQWIAQGHVSHPAAGEDVLIRPEWKMIIGPSLLPCTARHCSRHCSPS